MVKIAFYKAKYGSWKDKLVAWWTKGPYSHSEIIFSDGMWFSASTRDGNKTRFKKIIPNESHWDFITINISDIDEEDLRQFAEYNNNLPYDWIGIFFSQLMPFNCHFEKKWFCSEIIHAMMKWFVFVDWRDPSQMVDPNTLYNLLKEEE